MGKENAMTPADIESLERRNRLDQELVLIELKEIKAIAQSNDRALRGSNGDAGLVSDLEIIKSTVTGMGKAHGRCSEQFKALDKLLFGKDKDDAGMVGEQLTLKNYVFKDLKPNIDRMSWWFFTLVVGLIVTGIVSTVLSQ